MKIIILQCRNHHTFSNVTTVGCSLKLSSCYRTKRFNLQVFIHLFDKLLTEVLATKRSWLSTRNYLWALIL